MGNASRWGSVLVVASALALGAACSRGSDDAAPSAAPPAAPAQAGVSPAPAAPPAKPKTSGDDTGPGKRAPEPPAAKAPVPAKTTAPRAPVADRGLLRHLPENALAAVRVPRIASLKAAWTRAAWLRPWVEAITRQLEENGADTGLESLLEKAGVKHPDMRGLLSNLSQIEGEAVIGLVIPDVMSMMAASRGATPPVLLAAYFELGAREPAVRKHVEALQRAGWAGKVEVDLAIESGVLAVVAAPKGAGGGAGSAARSLKLDRARSFLATPVAADAPRVPAGATETCFEAFLNLDPVKEMLGLAPPSVRAFFQAQGLDRIHGFSHVIGTFDGGFAESVMLHGGAEPNLVTRFLASPPLQAELARWVAADAEGAGLMSLDLARILGEVRAMLPPKDQLGMDRDFAKVRKATGVDVKADLLEALGAQVLITGGRDASAAGGLDVVIAWELRKPERARTAIEKLLQTSGLQSQASRERISGLGEALVFDVELPELDSMPFDAGTLKPSLLFAEKCLFLASSPKALRAMAGAKAPAAGMQATFREALAAAPPGTFALNVTQGAAHARQFHELMTGVAQTSGLDLGKIKPMTAANVADTVLTARCDGGSVELASRSGVYPALTMGSVAGLAMASAVAIPNLLAARLSANENAARATLRYVVSAQAVFQSSALVDLDQDGVGEYGYLAELAGTVPVRGGGEKLDPPMLTAGMGTMTDGCVLKSGYVFRIDLPGREGEPLPEAPRGGARQAIPADAAEGGYAVYAWPQKHGVSGLRAFVIDESGALFECENTKHKYSGLENAPRGDAAFLTEGSNRGGGAGAMRLGRDGALWRRVTAPR